MLRSPGWIVLGILSATPALLAQNADQPAANATPSVHKAHHKKAKAVKPLPLPALPGGPLRQLPMDQIPATPAKVTYQGGLLTIAAQNSPLSEILRDVHRLTGATIEMPPRTAAADERVITRLGPGTPRDVLVALLNGSSFNYVMLGSNSDPSVISNIILTSKSGPGGEAQAAAAMPQNAPPGVVMPPHPMPPQRAFNPQAGQGAQPDNPEGEAPPEEEQQQDSPADENANAEEQAQPEEGQQDPSQPDPNQPNAGPKTPEQILEMLRRQQQPGAVTPPPQGQEQPPEQQ
jgi:hypothetical protein